MRRYYLHQRKGVFYAELIDPATGRKLPARSTFQSIRDDALQTVHDWLRDGVPEKHTPATRPASEYFGVSRVLDSLKQEALTSDDCQRIVDVLIKRRLLASATLAGSPGAELFTDFLTRFWNFKESPYVKEKAAHGQRIGEAHCDESCRRAKEHWLPFFAGKRLAEVNRDDLKRFSLEISSEQKNLAPNTRNRILVVGTTALRWAFLNGLTMVDPTVGIRRFSGKEKKRGILSPEEAKELFNLEWPDLRFKLANLLSATTGLRAGEVSGLRLEDINETELVIRHSWLEGYGLKAPKSGDTRRVPLLPSIRASLLELAARNPHGNGFVFWGATKASPMVPQNFSARLREMLITLAVGKSPSKVERENTAAYWTARNVLFHSWRHFYSARMSDSLDSAKIMRATGHKTTSVFEGYADHALESDLLAVGVASAKAFGNIVPFKAAL